MKEKRLLTTVGTMLAVVTVALIVILMLAPGASAAPTYKVLYQFTGGADGNHPENGVIFDADGNLYGTTYEGGAYGNGIVFELTPNADGSWTENVLYSFGGSGDGTWPWSGLVFDAAGNLYGTTMEAGAYGDGTVYKLTPNSDGSWTETVLYSFAGGRDGISPTAGLIFDTAGALYGTTRGGGRGKCQNWEKGCGTVFKLTPNSDGTWTESVLYRFGGGKDGWLPDHSNLLFDAAGNLYGATIWAGRYGCGTIFELTPESGGNWTEKILHQFNCTDGELEEGTLIFDKADNLCGTTNAGGHHDGGNVFKLSIGSDGKWRERVLHDFTGGRDGGNADGGLIFDTAGNLYGTTRLGGNRSGGGTVFELIPNSNGKWKEQVLHRFSGVNGEGTPSGVLVFDAAGNIYGTASADEASGSGVVYEITP